MSLTHAPSQPPEVLLPTNLSTEEAISSPSRSSRRTTTNTVSHHDITITRTGAAPKEDKLIIHFANAPANATDAAQDALSATA
ncbi:hypothetical protein CRE_04305 [Caenorhabditis remanei]|uniref:Uncharacterized protein n=1 Tax=Caenorhabditis remanei TaxID=31234 RepID=E3NE62_CAERE|nr:hypothetical protein CRE_04305 [Caenorhabditis remanei]